MQQPPKREGRNMIMFLGPRKTPLQKDKPEQATKAERTLPIAKPPGKTAAPAAAN